MVETEDVFFSFSYVYGFRYETLRDRRDTKHAHACGLMSWNEVSSWVIKRATPISRLSLASLFWGSGEGVITFEGYHVEGVFHPLYGYWFFSSLSLLFVPWNRLGGSLSYTTLYCHDYGGTPYLVGWHGKGRTKERLLYCKTERVGFEISFYLISFSSAA